MDDVADVVDPGEKISTLLAKRDEEDGEVLNARHLEGGNIEITFTPGE